MSWAICLERHHHDANCVEVAPALPDAGGPCTTMSPAGAGIANMFRTLDPGSRSEDNTIEVAQCALVGNSK